MTWRGWRRSRGRSALGTEGNALGGSFWPCRPMTGMHDDNDPGASSTFECSRAVGGSLAAAAGQTMWSVGSWRAGAVREPAT